MKLKMYCRHPLISVKVFFNGILYIYFCTSNIFFINMVLLFYVWSLYLTLFCSYSVCSVAVSLQTTVEEGKLVELVLLSSSMTPSLLCYCVFKWWPHMSLRHRFCHLPTDSTAAEGLGGGGCRGLTCTLTNLDQIIQTLNNLYNCTRGHTHSLIPLSTPSLFFKFHHSVRYVTGADLTPW